jgi:hypothetical protein
MRRRDASRRNCGGAAWICLALLFLSAQTLATAHAAHHGDPSHHHDDIPCAIQFAVDSARSLVAPGAAQDARPHSAGEVLPVKLSGLVYLSNDTSDRPIRGPPALLF